MNFVINVDPDRVIGELHELVVDIGPMYSQWTPPGAPLIYREVREDDGRTFVALVYEAVGE